MIGNDIIDLQLAAKQSNWKRKGFLDKLFSRQEQCYVFDSNEPFRVVWKLWSMKESAYKIHVRKTGMIRFNPRRFSCELTHQNKGMVQIDTHNYLTRTEEHREMMHTMAHDNRIEHEMLYGIMINKNIEDPGADIRKVLVKDLAERRKLPVEGLKINKNGLRIPELYAQNKKLKDLCSLSHHGRYSAYLLILL